MFLFDYQTNPKKFREFLPPNFRISWRQPCYTWFQAIWQHCNFYLPYIPPPMITNAMIHKLMAVNKLLKLEDSFTPIARRTKKYRNDRDCRKYICSFAIWAPPLPLWHKTFHCNVSPKPIESDQKVLSLFSWFWPTKAYWKINLSVVALHYLNQVLPTDAGNFKIGTEYWIWSNYFYFKE